MRMTHSLLHMNRIGYVQGFELVVGPVLHEYQHNVGRLGFVGPHPNGLEQVVPNDLVVERVVLNDHDYKVIQKLIVCSKLLWIALQLPAMHIKST